MSGPLLVVDNYDSFTYNLVQYLGQLGQNPAVIRNDATTAREVAALDPIGIVISPGPGTPAEAGICIDVVRELGSRTPILGVCLGHQCIGQAYGGAVVRAAQVMHGKLSQVEHDGKGVFAGLPSPLTATRYHSLVVDPKTLPAQLEATAWVTSSPAPPAPVLMGLRHRQYPVEGVQFHPESILTDRGHDLLRNFVDLCRERAAVPA